jgi:YVTN family beta-propeller protein
MVPVVLVAMVAGGPMGLVPSNVSAAAVTTASSPPECIYVGNRDSRNVSVLDASSGYEVAGSPIAMPSYPRSMAASPNGAKVYVGNQNGNIVVIDTATGTSDTTIYTDESEDLAVSPDNATVWSADGSQGVRRISAAGNFITNTIAIGAGGYAQALAVSPDGSAVWVHDSRLNEISVIDPVTKTVTRTITGLDRFGYRMVFSPDGSTVWLSHKTTDGTVSAKPPRSE